MAAEAVLTSHLHKETEEIHWEHEHLMDELTDLDSALDEIDFDSAPVPRLAGVEDASRIVRDLLAELPQHFANEEATVLPAIATVNPILSAFSSEMTRQHHEIWKALNLVAAELRHLKSSDDLAEDIVRVQGHIDKLCRALITHMKAEEHMYVVLDDHQAN
jgi:iron-sulfur cluster repair protein YtfE (RIC family)